MFQRFRCELSQDNYFTLTHAADQTHENDPKQDQGFTCMNIIDSDR